MVSVMRSLLSVALRVCAAALVLVGAVCVAQEPHGSKYPRPNLASEGQVVVRENGLAVKFFESVADNASQGGMGAQRKYILYEPPIFLLTRPDGEGRRVLDTGVSQDGVATVNFYWDTDPKLTHEAIRTYLETTSGYGAELKDAIIKPLFVNVGWFESARDATVRSQEFPPQSFNTSGRIRAFFEFGEVAKAQEFVDALNAVDESLTPVQLNFRYSFSGDARDTCFAEVTSEQIAETDRFKSLVGEGGVGRVTRRQVADIAEEVFKSVDVQATCRDLAVADRLARQAREQLGAPERLAT